MTSKTKSCYIRSEDDSLLTVFLPDKTPVIVGRSPETNIRDTKCSRQQVRLYANYEDNTVIIQQISKHACGLNGFSTTKDTKIVAVHNDRLEILYGKYPYHIEFNPPPTTKETSRKRSYEPDESTDTISSPHKMLKLDKTDSDNTCDNRNEQQSSDSKDDEIVKNSLGIKETSNSKNISTKLWDSLRNGELLIYTPSEIQHSSKIAAYDMDGTIITTKSGLVFPKDCNDWQIIYAEVPTKLKQLHSEGYKIVIFTNQGRLGSGKIKINDFKAKIERIIQRLGVPIQAFIAAGQSIYRKPAIGMWEVLKNDKNDSVPIDMSNSFYVGDAAGRQKNWAPGKKKDHSCVDRTMAMNVGLKFQTPEEHFLGRKEVAYQLPPFNPKAIPKDRNLCDPSDTKLTPEKQEVVLMVGTPGSGKSHFAKTYLKDHSYINRDILGSWQKCVSLMEEFLNQGKSVVIDNTNPDVTSRQRYIDVAKRYRIPVRCFVMKTDKWHAKHNIKFRAFTDPTHVKVNEIIVDSYVKNYVPPDRAEGLSDIIYVNFVPQFSSEKDRILYEMYLLE